MSLVELSEKPPLFLEILDLFPTLLLFRLRSIDVSLAKKGD